MDLKMVAKQKDDDAEANGEFVVTPSLKIPESRVKDLICTGFEGGVGYWCQIIDYEFASGLSLSDFKMGGKMQDPDSYYHPSELIPFTKGCATICQEMDDEEPNPNPERKLDRAAIDKGLGIMMNKYPHNWDNFINEDEDACTGDVFIQCCLLGKVIYG